LARTDYIERTKSILYGTGLGEKPRIIEVAADAAETIAANTIAFSVTTGSGSAVKPGHILSRVGSTDETDAYSMYVLSVATDVITATRTYNGSPDAGFAADLLDGLLLEGQPLRSEYEINKAIDAVFQTWLYPDVYTFTTGSVAPDPTYGQVELPATVREIDAAWQVVAGQNVTIPHAVHRNLHTTVSSTGVQGVFDQVDNSTIYYTYKTKLVVGSEVTDPNAEALVYMVAMGAAGLALDSSVVDQTLERAKKDSQQRRDSDAASRLFRSFLTMRQQWGAEDAEDYVEIQVQRSLGSPARGF
jgi:hypothetical protein